MDSGVWENDDAIKNKTHKIRGSQEIELLDQWPPLPQPRTLVPAAALPFCRYKLSPDWGALSSSFPADSTCESHFDMKVERELGAPSSYSLVPEVSSRQTYSWGENQNFPF